MALDQETRARIQSFTNPLIGAGLELGRQKLTALISPTENHLQAFDRINPFHWETNFAVITSRISQLFAFGLFLAGEQARVSRTGQAAHWLVSLTRGAVALATPAIAVASVKAIEVLGDSSASLGEKFGAGFIALTALFAVGSMAESAIQIIKNRKEVLKEKELIAKSKRAEANDAAFHNLLISHTDLLNEYGLNDEGRQFLLQLANSDIRSFLQTIRELRQEGQNGLNFINQKTVEYHMPSKNHFTPAAVINK